jgi:hypothetical protein
MVMFSEMHIHVNKENSLLKAGCQLRKKEVKKLYQCPLVTKLINGICYTSYCIRFHIVIFITLIEICS